MQIDIILKNLAGITDPPVTVTMFHDKRESDMIHASCIHRDGSVNFPLIFAKHFKKAKRRLQQQGAREAKLYPVHSQL